MSEIDADIRRRHLLVIATGHYDNPDVWPPLPVADEVKVWTDWLTDDGLADRRFTHLAPDLANDPKFPRLMEFLHDELNQIRSSDALVVVVTGHGIVADRVHRIVLANAGKGPLRESEALRTDQLISFLKDTKVQNALVVIDTCHAGEVTRQMLYDNPLPVGWIGIAAAAPEGQARAGAVADAVRAFLSRAPGDERHGGPNQRHFQASDLVQFITDELGEDQDVVTFPRQAKTKRSPCLPNPAFSSAHEGLVGTATQRQDLALREEDVAAHWGPRARGVQHDGETGWLFTGRSRLLRDLIGMARGIPGTCIVTGAAGTGKSAVLARLVTLSDPGFRAGHPDLIAAIPHHVRPEPGDVDVAIHARGKTAAEILEQLCTAYDLTLDADDTAVGLARQQQTQLKALRRRLASHRHATTIVIDALDEANDPRDVLTNLLVPLSTDWKEPILRLILGVRSADDPHRSEDGGAAPTLVGACRTLLDATELRVDAAPYWNTEDLVDYVTNILTTPAPGRGDTPYTTAPHKTRALARKVAQLVGTSYLVAQIAARQLAVAEMVQDPDDPTWQSLVSDGLSSVLQVELADAFPDQDDRRRALTVLRAASLAFGHGIPWRRIWPAIATAIAEDGQDYDDSDIRWLLGHRIGGYLVRDLDDDGTTVYRPFHDALRQALALLASPPKEISSDALSTAPGAGRTTGKLPQKDSEQYLAEQHERIVQVLAALLPASPTDTTIEPDRYLRRHLAEHAAASGRLDQLLEGARFLVIADPDALLPLLATAKHAAGPVYRQIAHQLRGRPPQEKAMLLELTANLVSKWNVARQFDELLIRPPWRVKWAHTNSATPHTIITTQFAGRDIALTELKGRPVIVAGVQGGGVEVWDLATGTPINSLMTGHTEGIASLAVGEVNGRPVVGATAISDKVWVWDLDSGTLINSLMTGETEMTGSFTALTVGEANGRPIVGAAAIRNQIWVWDLASGTLIDSPPTEHIGVISTLAISEVRGLPVIVSASDSQVWVWDMVTGTSARSLASENMNPKSRPAYGELDGRPVIVSGSHDGTIRAWDVATGRSIGKPVTVSDDWYATGVAEVEGQPLVILFNYEDNAFQVHDLATGTPISPSLIGHKDSVGPVSAGELNGRPVFVSGSDDGTIRLWDLAPGTPIVDTPTTDSNKPVSALATGELGGQPVVVSGSNDGTIRVRDLATGMLIVDSPAMEHDEAVSALATGRVGGQPVVVSVDRSGLVAVWDCARGTHIELRGRWRWQWRWKERRRSPITKNGGMVSAVAVSEVEGRLLVVAGEQFYAPRGDGTILVWDCTTGTRRGRLRTKYPVEAVVVAEVDGRPVVVSGSREGVHVWDLAAGTTIDSDSAATGHTHRIRAVAVAEAGGRPVIVSGSYDGTLQIWDLSICTPIGSPLAGHTRMVTAVAVAEVGGRQVIVSGSEDGMLRLWDPGTGQPLFALPLGGSIEAICARGPLISIGVANSLIVLELVAISR